MAEVVLLWGIFLLTQQLKSAYPNCTWQYFTIFAAQVLFLLGVTAFSVWCAPCYLLRLKQGLWLTHGACFCASHAADPRSNWSPDSSVTRHNELLSVITLYLAKSRGERFVEP